MNLLGPLGNYVLGVGQWHPAMSYKDLFYGVRSYIALPFIGLPCLDMSCLTVLCYTLPCHALQCFNTTVQTSAPNSPWSFDFSNFPATLHPHHVILNVRYCRAHRSTVLVSKSSQVRMQSMWVLEQLHQRTYWGWPFRNTTRASHIHLVSHTTHVPHVTSHIHTLLSFNLPSSHPPSYTPFLLLLLLSSSVFSCLVALSPFISSNIFSVCAPLRCVQHCWHHKQLKENEPSNLLRWPAVQSV